MCNVILVNNLNTLHDTTIPNIILAHMENVPGNCKYRFINVKIAQIADMTRTWYGIKTKII